MAEAKTKKPGIIWMSSREVAMTAALGGLGFASVALGLIIPILPGGGSVFALQGLSPISSIAGGPIVGFLVTAIMGTPRTFAVVNWFLALGQLIVAFGYYPLRNKSLPVRLGGFIILDFISWEAYGNWIGTWFLVDVYKVVPPDGFWPLWAFMATVFTGATLIIDAIFVSIAFIIFPKFMKPDWWDRWRGR